MRSFFLAVFAMFCTKIAMSYTIFCGKIIITENRHKILKEERK